MIYITDDSPLQIKNVNSCKCYNADYGIYDAYIDDLNNIKFTGDVINKLINDNKILSECNYDVYKVNDNNNKGSYLKLYNLPASEFNKWKIILNDAQSEDELAELAINNAKRRILKNQSIFPANSDSALNSMFDDFNDGKLSYNEFINNINSYINKYEQIELDKTYLKELLNDNEDKISQKFKSSLEEILASLNDMSGDRLDRAEIEQNVKQNINEVNSLKRSIIDICQSVINKYGNDWNKNLTAGEKKLIDQIEPPLNDIFKEFDIGKIDFETAKNMITNFIKDFDNKTNNDNNNADNDELYNMIADYVVYKRSELLNEGRGKEAYNYLQILEVADKTKLDYEQGNISAAKYQAVLQYIIDLYNIKDFVEYDKAYDIRQLNLNNNDYNIESTPKYFNYEISKINKLNKNKDQPLKEIAKIIYKKLKETKTSDNDKFIISKIAGAFNIGKVNYKDIINYLGYYYKNEVSEILDQYIENINNRKED